MTRLVDRSGVSALTLKMIEDHIEEDRAFHAMISARLDKIIWSMIGGMGGVLFLVIERLLAIMPLH